VDNKSWHIVDTELIQKSLSTFSRLRVNCSSKLIHSGYLKLVQI
jgi:hypothetical protein